MPTHAELAKIHIAKRDLKLTDPLYRGLLNVLFGQGSERDLTQEQVEELLEHFKSLGWKSEYTKSEMGRKQSEPKVPPPPTVVGANLPRWRRSV